MSAIVQYRGANLLLGLWALCLFVGPALAAVTSDELGRGLDLRFGARMMLLMLSAGVSLYVLLWSRTLVGPRRTAALYAIGLVLQGVSDFPAIAHNPWKFGFAFPVAICLLAAARTRAQVFFVLATTASISVIFQFRSFAAMCALTIIVMLVGTSNGSTRRKFDARFLATFSLSTILVYQIGTIGLLNGWFGAGLQNLALTQSRGGQVSLVVGARPEFASALALFQSRPMGFGPGVIPNLNDVATGINALDKLGVNTNTAYVKSYLFGDKLELHSVIGDLWLLFGLLGLILSAAILWYLMSGLLSEDTRLATGALGVLAGIVALWDLAFSPLSAVDNVVLTLALLLPAVTWGDDGLNSREGEE